MLSCSHVQALAELFSEALRHDAIRTVLVRFLAEAAPLLPSVAAERGEDLLTKHEVAEMLGCCERTISNYMRQQGLTPAKRSGRVMFKRADFFRWAQEHGKSIAKPRGI